METRAEASNCSEIQRQEVKEERTVGFRRQGDHLAFLLVDRLIENMLQVRCFTAQTGAVINDLAVNFASGKVYETQGSPSIRARARNQHACGSEQSSC